MTERVIRLVLDPSGVESGGQRSEQALNKVDRATKSTSDSMNALKQAAIAAIGYLGAREILQTADAYSKFRNTLRDATDSQEELNAVTSEVTRLAQSTRTSLETTAELYDRMERSTKLLGLSQRDVLELTEAVSLATQVSGDSAETAAENVTMFARSLETGATDARAFLPLLTQVPRLADAIAEGMGKNTAELARMAREGELDAGKLAQAIQSQLPKLRGEFSEFDVTIESAMTTVKNFVTVTVGSFNQAAGITEGISRIFSLTGDQTDSLAERVTELGLSFREFVEVSTVAIAEFASEVPLKLNTVQGVLVQMNATLAHLVFGQGLSFGIQEALQQELDGIAARRVDIEHEVDLMRKQMDEEFELIKRNSEERRKAILDGRSDSPKPFDLTVKPPVINLPKPADIDAAKDKLKELLKQEQDMTETLNNQEAAFKLATEAGIDYDKALEHIEIQKLADDTLAAAAAMRALGKDVQATGLEQFAAETIAAADNVRALKEQADAMEAAFKRGADNKDFIENLLLQREALQTAIETGREYSQVLAELELRQKFAGDAQGFKEALDVSREVDKLKEQLDDAAMTMKDFLKKARENSQDVLAGFLADPMAEGLDQLPGKFAKVLADLAAQMLASEIFKLLGDFGKSGGFGGQGSGGGFASMLASFFGGAAEGTSGLQAGDWGVVGEKGPELFKAPGPGSIVPNHQMNAAPIVNVNPQIINVRDPKEIPAAMQSAEGTKVILNVLRENPNALRQLSA